MNSGGEGGALIPFGSLVHFKPNEAHGFKQTKFEPRAIPGVFAGYSLKDGYRWDNHYYVWPLGTFRDLDLGVDALPTSFGPLTAHFVKEIEVPAG